MPRTFPTPQVKSVSYGFPTDHEDTKCYSIVCRLTLEVMGFPARVTAAASRHNHTLATAGTYPLAYRSDSFQPPGENELSTTFSVTIRDSDTPDFLVAERRYNEGVNADWKPSRRVMMEWAVEDPVEAGGGEGDGEGGQVGRGLQPFYGVVTKVAQGEQDGNEQWPNSPWDCLTIKWDGDNTPGLLGPWEPRLVSGCVPRLCRACRGFFGLWRGSGVIPLCCFPRRAMG